MSLKKKEEEKNVCSGVRILDIYDSKIKVNGLTYCAVLRDC